MKAPRLSLQAILLIVSVFMLSLPLVGIHFLKIYESALIRQTESELISQAAFIASAYKNEVVNQLEHAGSNPETYGRKPKFPASAHEYYQPIPPTIDLSRDTILPPRPDGMSTGTSADRAARVAGEKINPILKDAQRVTMAGMKVLDYRGVVVAGQQETGQSFIRIDEVKQALWGQPVSVLRKRPAGREQPPINSISRGADINVFVALPIMLDKQVIGVAYVNRTPNDIVKALYGKIGDIVLAGAVVLLITLGIAAFVSYTVTRPIYALIDQARRLSAGDKEAIQPIHNPVTQEIATLSESFSNMARTIEHRSEYIRRFAMQVSHEFKTPLTSIQGSVELLQDHADEMPIEKRERFLRNIAEDTDRLKRLVTRLLELARADVGEPVTQPTLLRPILGRIAERYRDHGLKVSIEGDSPSSIVVSEEVLETVLTNLLDNSRQHDASEVRLTMATTEGDRLSLLVADDGQGITEANRQQVFTPFFTTKRDQGGTGLGLSITQALLTSQNGDIRCIASEKGAVFQLTFPLYQSA